MSRALAVLLMALAFLAPLSAAPVYQLRTYEIFAHNKAAFHERFRDHAMRIMRDRYGFDFVALWETQAGDRTEFIYLLRWPDESAMKAQWARFMADEEWSAIKKRTGAVHGKLVGGIQERVLKPIEYSPEIPAPPAGSR